MSTPFGTVIFVYSVWVVVFALYVGYWLLRARAARRALDQAEVPREEQS